MNPCDGKYCFINALRDLYMDTNARPFIHQLCRIIKITKSGLIQVHLAGQPKRTYSFARHNVEIIEPEDLKDMQDFLNLL
jgi:hypothetical protein